MGIIIPVDDGGGYYYTIVETRFLLLHDIFVVLVRFHVVVAIADVAVISMKGSSSCVSSSHQGVLGAVTTGQGHCKLIYIFMGQW